MSSFYGLLGVIAFVVALLATVVLHEFGHFVTAKRFGMKATQFFVGFGPTLWSRRRGETEYGIKAIPLGGFVRIVGYTPLERIEPGDERRAFYRQPARQRAIVIGAGVLMNFVAAYLLLIGLNMGTGLPAGQDRTAVIESVSACVPATMDRPCEAGRPAAPAAQARGRPGGVIRRPAGPELGRPELGHPGEPTGHRGPGRRGARGPAADAPAAAGHRRGARLRRHLATGGGRPMGPARAAGRRGRGRRADPPPPPPDRPRGGRAARGDTQALLPGAGRDPGRAGGQRVRGRPGVRGDLRLQSVLAIQGLFVPIAGYFDEHLHRGTQRNPTPAAGRRPPGGTVLRAAPGLDRPNTGAGRPGHRGYDQAHAGDLRRRRAARRPRGAPHPGRRVEPVETPAIEDHERRTRNALH